MAVPCAFILMKQNYVYALVLGNTTYAFYLDKNKAEQHKEYINKLDQNNSVEIQKHYISDSRELPKLREIYQSTIKLDLIYTHNTFPQIKDTKTLNKKSIDKLSTKEREKLENSISIITKILKNYSIYEVGEPEVIYHLKDDYKKFIDVPQITEAIPPINQSLLDQSNKVTFVVQSIKSKQDASKQAQQLIQSIIQYLNSIGFERINN